MNIHYLYSIPIGHEKSKQTNKKQKNIESKQNLRSTSGHKVANPIYTQDVSFLS